jgi:hypothetical protein
MIGDPNGFSIFKWAKYITHTYCINFYKNQNVKRSDWGRIRLREALNLICFLCGMRGKNFFGSFARNAQTLHTLHVLHGEWI